MTSASNLTRIVSSFGALAVACALILSGQGPVGASVAPGPLDRSAPNEVDGLVRVSATAKARAEVALARGALRVIVTDDLGRAVPDIRVVLVPPISEGTELQGEAWFSDAYEGLIDSMLPREERVAKLAAKAEVDLELASRILADFDSMGPGWVVEPDVARFSDEVRFETFTDSAGVAEFSDLVPASGYRFGVVTSLEVDVEPPHEGRAARKGVDGIVVDSRRSGRAPLGLSGPIHIEAGVETQCSTTAYVATAVRGWLEPQEGAIEDVQAHLRSIEDVDLDGDGTPEYSQRLVDAVQSLDPDGAFDFIGVRGDQWKELSGFWSSMSGGILQYWFYREIFYCKAGQAHDLGYLQPKDGATVSGHVQFTDSDGHRMSLAEVFVDPGVSPRIVVDVEGASSAVGGLFELDIDVPFAFHGLDAGENEIQVVQAGSGWGQLRPGLRVVKPTEMIVAAGGTDGLVIHYRVDRVRRVTLEFPGVSTPLRVFVQEGSGPVSEMEFHPTPGASEVVGTFDAAYGPVRVVAHSNHPLNADGASYFCDERVEVSMYGPDAFQIDVAHAASALVQCVEPDGEPRVGGWVKLHLMDRPMMLTSWADEYGIAWIGGLPPGSSFVIDGVSGTHLAGVAGETTGIYQLVRAN